MLRHYANVSFRQPATYGGLSPRCRLLVQYVDENLDQNISLSDLAGVVQLSAFISYGNLAPNRAGPPHAYVMQRRIEHAKRQMARRDIPLKVVAADCGFSDQSHMTRLFAGCLGTTPAAYRNAVSS